MSIESYFIFGFFIGIFGITCLIIALTLLSKYKMIKNNMQRQNRTINKLNRKNAALQSLLYTTEETLQKCFQESANKVDRGFLLASLSNIDVSEATDDYSKGWTEAMEAVHETVNSLSDI